MLIKKSPFLLFSFLIFLFSLVACRFDFDAGPRAAATVFVPVTEITGIPTGTILYITTHLTGTVMPENATNKRIEWSIANQGGTSSTIDGNRLTANNYGTVTVTARIEDGLGAGIDFTEDFDILITDAPVAVKDITGIPAALPVGNFTYTLNGTVIPTNAVNKSISWSVIDQGGTGAEIYGNDLTATSKGTVTIRATVQGGLLEDGDYTKDFTIAITKGVVAAGQYRLDSTIIKACYWIDGEFVELTNAGAITEENAALYTPYRDISFTSGIVEANGKLYIAGHYTRNDNHNQSTICYWVNGTEKTLPDSTGAYVHGSSISSCESWGIAEGGGFVYILGRTAQSSFCYWKIDANDDSAVPTKVTLTMPSGATSASIKIVVKNNGNVVIAGGVLSNYGSTFLGNYYWESSGSNTTLNYVRINEIGSNESDSVAVVNNKVYLAGNQYVSENLTAPYYYCIEDDSFQSVSFPAYASAAYNSLIATVSSLIEQNGSLVFYGSISVRHGGVNLFDDYFCYWDTEGNITSIPYNSGAYDFTKVVFSDGDAYVPAYVNTEVIFGLTYGSGGYMVLREPFPFRSLGVNVPYSRDFKNYVSGLVVR
jgi:hypothetical protein